MSSVGLLSLMSIKALNGGGGGASVTTCTEDEIYEMLDEVFGSHGYYTSISKIEDYAYNVEYVDLNYDYAYEYFKSNESPYAIGACSSVRNENFYGRKYDWLYDNSVSFRVHVPAAEGRYESHGIAGGVPSLTESVVSSGEFKQAYKLVPFFMLDGINQNGVFANANVVPTDKGYNKSIPTETSEVEISSLMVIRYILDHFATAREAVNYMQKHMTIYSPKKLHDMNYELHFMVGDATDNFVVEFENNQAVILEANYMTNFHLNDVTFNQDGTVYTPATNTPEHNAIDTNGVTENGSGLERYNYIVEHYSSAVTETGMKTLLSGLDYTKAYITSPNPSDPYWFTEFVGDGLTCGDVASDFADIVEAAGEEFERRSRSDDSTTWQSVHSVIYNLTDNSMNVVFQESGVEHSYPLATPNN